MKISRGWVPLLIEVPWVAKESHAVHLIQVLWVSRKLMNLREYRIRSIVTNSRIGTNGMKNTLDISQSNNNRQNPIRTIFQSLTLCLLCLWVARLDLEKLIMKVWLIAEVSINNRRIFNKFRLRGNKLKIFLHNKNLEFRTIQWDLKTLNNLTKIW